MTQRALKAEMGIQEVAHKVNCFLKDVPTFHVYTQHGSPRSLQSPVRPDMYSSTTIVDVGGPVLRLLQFNSQAVYTDQFKKKNYHPEEN